MKQHVSVLYYGIMHCLLFLFGKPRYRLKDNIKIHFKEMECTGQRQVAGSFDTLRNLRVP